MVMPAPLGKPWPLQTYQVMLFPFDSIVAGFTTPFTREFIVNQYYQGGRMNSWIVIDHICGLWR